MNNPVLRAEDCPFCGSKARFGTALMRGRRPGEPMRERAHVGCKRCRLMRVFDTVIEALGWWNKRA